VTAPELAAALPDIATLRERSRTLALLDTIVSGRSAYSRYSYDARWAPGTELAGMSNGAGDAYSIVFSPAGAFLRGFDHESPMSPYATDDALPWPGLTTGIPQSLAAYVDEPAFHLDDTFCATVCLWRETTADRWHTGDPVFPDEPDPDGSDWMFGTLLDPTSASYTDFAGDYYETTIDAAAVAELWATRTLTPELLHRLNPEVTPEALAPDLSRMGWPGSLRPGG
jgi:hypothetical protein